MKIKKLSESIDVATIGDYVTDHYEFDDIDDKYNCIDSIRDSFKGQKTISEEELEQFIGSHNGKDKVNESNLIKEGFNDNWTQRFSGMNVYNNGDYQIKSVYLASGEEGWELGTWRNGKYVRIDVYKDIDRAKQKAYDLQYPLGESKMNENTRGQGKYSDKFYDYASYLEQNDMNGDGWYLINQLIRYCKEDDLKDLWIERMSSVAEKAGFGSEDNLNEDIELKPKKGPEEGPMFGLASTLNAAIQDELKTIDNYNSLAVTAKDCNAEFMIDVINDINTEENKHVGQLQQLLKMISPNAEAINAGEKETEETTGWYYHDDDIMEMPYQYQ